MTGAPPPVPRIWPVRTTAAYEFSTRSAVAQDTDPWSMVTMTGTFAPVRVVPQVWAAPGLLAAPDAPQPAGARRDPDRRHGPPMSPARESR